MINNKKKAKAKASLSLSRDFFLKGLSGVKTAVIKYLLIKLTFNCKLHATNYCACIKPKVQ